MLEREKVKWRVLYGKESYPLVGNCHRNSGERDPGTRQAWLTVMERSGPCSGCRESRASMRGTRPTARSLAQGRATASAARAARGLRERGSSRGGRPTATAPLHQVASLTDSSAVRPPCPRQERASPGSGRGPRLKEGFRNSRSKGRSPP